jgi:nicotinamidase-related amidase
MKALLIIDMQEGSFTPASPRFNAESVVQKINLLSDRFRKNGDKVIFIQHNGTKENAYIPGTHDWMILSALVVEPDDMIIAKTANDAFYQTELRETLHQFGIADLFITGCATDFCVDSTVRSALANNFNVIVVKDCHTTADRPHLNAEKVIEHHNWLWENMISTKGKIKSVLSEDLLKCEKVV